MLSSETCSRHFLGIEGNCNDVLLVFPGKYRAPDPQIPLALLHLAAALRYEGFNVRILDMRLDNYRRYRIGKPLFVGISCMSGPQIKYALEFARHVRSISRFIPLLWGGVHPTLLPEQTARNEYVDLIIRGEGELAIVDIANALAMNQPIDEVAGITYQVGDTVKSNPDGKTVDLDAIPIALPYELLSLERYPSFLAGRFHIQTSRGCPHHCGFCYNTTFNRNRWRGKSASRVLDEIEYVLARFPHIKIIDPIDDNVFVDEYRVKRICQGLIDRRIKIQWRANCRFDYLADYDRDFLTLLEQSGCVELDFGGESGSEQLQNFMGKDVTADEMLQSVSNLERWTPKIQPYVSWISGLPDETDKELAETLNLMDNMLQINSKIRYNIFVYTPFPSPLIQFLPSPFRLPQSLEEWGNIQVFHYNPPWHSKEQTDKLHTISAITRLAFYPEDRAKEQGLPFWLAYLVINKIEQYRWRHRNFNFPVELRVADALAKRFKGFL